MEMVGFVHDRKRRRTAPAQRVAMKLEKLRGCEHDVPRSFAQRLEELVALLVIDRTVRAKAAQPKRIEGAPQRLVLVVGQRPQRIDDQRLSRPGKGTQRR